MPSEVRHPGVTCRLNYCCSREAQLASRTLPARCHRLVSKGFQESSTSRKLDDSTQRFIGWISSRFRGRRPRCTAAGVINRGSAARSVHQQSNKHSGCATQASTFGASAVENPQVQLMDKVVDARCCATTGADGPDNAEIRGGAVHTMLSSPESTDGRVPRTGQFSGCAGCSVSTVACQAENSRSRALRSFVAHSHPDWRALQRYFRPSTQRCCGCPVTCSARSITLRLASRRLVLPSFAWKTTDLWCPQLASPSFCGRFFNHRQPGAGDKYWAQDHGLRRGRDHFDVNAQRPGRDQFDEYANSVSEIKTPQHDHPTDDPSRRI